MKTPSRLFFGAILLACAGLLSFAIYLQEEVGLEPCPMCILQRYAFTLIAIVALAAVIHGPRGGAFPKVYGALVVLLAIAGGGVAARQSYIQHFPPATTSCGTDLEFLVNTFPISQALPKIFAGSADCAAVHWRLLGMSIAEWALVWFVLFVAATVWFAFARKAR
ncbi:MAG TPA: disulfide bond formation protein B [Usitatibacter sp.]|nr:disulfide bond formation protein B [Usitatibacter sp.]